MNLRLPPAPAANLTAPCARVLTLCLLLVALPVRAEEGDGHPGWTASGDALQWAIPLLGLGLTFFGDSGFDLDNFGGGAGLNWPGPGLDHSPQRDFLVSFLRMETTTYTLKYAIDARRPNGGRQSFPSGHTSAAFMGAEFIRKQYGPWWGAPAYAAASWVGYTRLDAHQHYWRDVLAGAAIGIASNHDFDSVETRFGTLQFGPTLFNTAVTDDAARNEPPGHTAREAWRPAPGLRFELRF